MDDDDADGNRILPTFTACDCEDNHVTKLLNCIGCGKCYFQSLNDHNATLKGNVDVVDADFDSDDDMENQQPDYGALRWFCPDCEHLLNNCGAQSFLGFYNTMLDKKDKKLKPIPQNDDLLTKLAKETAEIKVTLNHVVAHLEGLSTTVDAKSPKRKAARVAWGEDNNVSTLNFGSILPTTMTSNQLLPSTDISGSPIPTANILKLKESDSDRVKLNVKSNSNNVLKELHENRHLVSGVSTRKKKYDGSLDILFKTFSDAKKAKELFDEKLKDATVSSPSLDGLAKFNLVGLTFEMEKYDIIQSIMEENNSWLDLVKISEDTIGLRNDPFAVLSVGNIIKCRNNEVFRILITMSKRMRTFIGKRKISVGFTKCYLYDIANHGRCYKCQRPGHFARECPNALACSRCSLEHSFQDCKSVHVKCVNCTINSKDNINHPSFSNLCPFNTTR